MTIARNPRRPYAMALPPDGMESVATGYVKRFASLPHEDLCRATIVVSTQRMEGLLASFFHQHRPSHTLPLPCLVTWHRDERQQDLARLRFRNAFLSQAPNGTGVTLASMQALWLQCQARGVSWQEYRQWHEEHHRPCPLSHPSYEALLSLPLPSLPALRTLHERWEHRRPTTPWLWIGGWDESSESLAWMERILDHPAGAVLWPVPTDFHAESVPASHPYGPWQRLARHLKLALLPDIPLDSWTSLLVGSNKETSSRKQREEQEKRAVVLSRGFAPTSSARVMPSLPSTATSEWLARWVVPSDSLEDEAHGVVRHMVDSAPLSRGTPAVVVTYDRDLTARIGQELRSLGWTVDDAHGEKLTTNPWYRWWVGLLGWGHEQATDRSLWMAVLSDPFTDPGEADGTAMTPRDHFRHWMLAETTGWHPDRMLKTGNPEDCFDLALPEKAASWWSRHALRWMAWVRQWPNLENPLECYRAHAAWALEVMRPEDTLNEIDREAMAHAMVPLTSELAQEWMEACVAGMRWMTSDYRQWLDRLHEGRTVRLAALTSPDVRMVSPNEALYTPTHCLVLCGLSEGSWPQSLRLNPLMPSWLCGDVGWPSPEDQRGQAATRFWALAQQPMARLSYHRRRFDRALRPSPWISRLLLAMQRRVALPSYRAPWPAAREDAPHPRAPLPSPPLELRPRRYSVSDIGLLMRNPYHYYVEKILCLRPLPISSPWSMRDFGIWMHGLFERWNRIYVRYVRSCRGVFLEDQCLALLQMAIEESWHAPSLAAAYCWPGMAAALAPSWLAWRRTVPLHSETERRMEQILLVGDVVCEIVGVADIVLSDVAAGIRMVIDYKTGRLPTRSDIACGLAPQLDMLAWLWESIEPEGEAILRGYASVKSSSLAVSLVETEDRLATTDAGIRSLLHRFLVEGIPYYYRLRHAGRHSVEWLARVQSWGWNPSGTGP